MSYRENSTENANPEEHDRRNRGGRIRGAHFRKNLFRVNKFVLQNVKYR